MEKFKNQFLKLLRENPELERQAMEASLDDGISGDDFDLDMDDVGEFDEVGDAINRRNQQEVATLDGWISQIDQFLKTLNSDDPSSMQSKLAKAVPDTIMDKVKQSQQTKISRVASDLASLHQSFLGFKAMSSNPSLKNV
jgi:hypothetical protein